MSAEHVELKTRGMNTLNVYADFIATSKYQPIRIRQRCDANPDHWPGLLHRGESVLRESRPSLNNVRLCNESKLFQTL